MTMRQNSFSIKKFERYQNMVQGTNLKDLFIIPKSDKKGNDDGSNIIPDELDLTATTYRLRRYIPEFPELSEVMSTEEIEHLPSPSVSGTNSPVAPKSKKMRSDLMKRAELLRERAIQLQISINSATATHFLFFDTFKSSENDILRQYKKILIEPSTNETWRFPETKWSQERIRAGIALAQYSETQELVSSDLVLTVEGIGELEILAAKFRPISNEDEREQLQSKYRNLLLVLGTGKKRDFRLPTQSQLERISAVVSDLSGQSESERTDNDSMRLISEKSSSSTTLADFVVRAMSWGNQEKVDFNFSALLEKLRELEPPERAKQAKKLCIKGLELYLRRSGSTKEVDDLSAEIESFYSGEIKTQGNPDHDFRQAVGDFAKREADRFDGLLKSYIQKLKVGLSEIPEQQENLDEYLESLGHLFEKSKLEKQLSLDVEDFLLSLAPQSQAIDIKK